MEQYKQSEISTQGCTLVLHYIYSERDCVDDVRTNKNQHLLTTDPNHFITKVATGHEPQSELAVMHSTSKELMMLTRTKGICLTSAKIL